MQPSSHHTTTTRRHSLLSRVALGQKAKGGMEIVKSVHLTHAVKTTGLLPVTKIASSHKDNFPRPRSVVSINQKQSHVVLSTPADACNTAASQASPLAHFFVLVILLYTTRC